MSEPPCEFCQGTQGVELISALTSYPNPELTVWDRLAFEEGGLSEPPNPNPPLFLCVRCTKEYTEHWEGMWAEYHAGLL
jgi:hypothetical protein